jgi:hypothetical protein
MPMDLLQVVVQGHAQDGFLLIIRLQVPGASGSDSWFWGNPIPFTQRIPMRCIPSAQCEPGEFRALLMRHYDCSAAYDYACSPLLFGRRRATPPTAREVHLTIDTTSSPHIRLEPPQGRPCQPRLDNPRHPG